MKEKDKIPGKDLNETEKVIYLIRNSVVIKMLTKFRRTIKPEFQQTENISTRQKSQRSRI